MGKGGPSTRPANMTSRVRHLEESAVVSQLFAQLGMFSNCGRSSGFAHLRRRLVNISSTGSMPSGLSRLPSVTKIIPRKASRLLVNTLAPHSGQKFRSEPASPLEGESHGANPSLKSPAS